MKSSVVAVAGARGFIGSLVLGSTHGDVVQRPLPSFRIEEQLDASAWIARNPVVFRTLVHALEGVDAVVNAAGLADASAPLSRCLGPNVTVALVVQRAAETAGVPRLVHISSAAVQGFAATLDDSARQRPFSGYSASKAMAEVQLVEAARSTELVLFRPTSVLGEGRPTSRKFLKLLRRRLFLPVIRNGQLPLALGTDVAAAAIHLATVAQPPPIAVHPWQGVTFETARTALGVRAGLAFGGRALRPWAERIDWQRARWHSGMWTAGACALRRIDLAFYGQDNSGSALSTSGWSALDMNASLPTLAGITSSEVDQQRSNAQG